MPEGPEAKISSNYLNKILIYESSFQIVSEYYLDKYSKLFEKINSNMIKHELSFTVGKNIFLKLKDEQFLRLHLGMTGGWSDINKKHCHFKISNAYNTLYFVDIRKFGKIDIISKQKFSSKYDNKFDSLNKNYNMLDHYNFLQNKIKPYQKICKILLNQQLFPGVGNYIKSESLYKTNIHPEESWGLISDENKKKLITNTKIVMNQSYKNGGAELKDFKNPFKNSNYQLQIYGKKSTTGNIKVYKIKTSDQRSTWISENQKLSPNNFV